MLRLILIAVLIFAALIANHVYVVRNGISRDSDYAYLARNCESGITPEQADNIAAHITYDRSLGGHGYLFDQVAGVVGPGAFFIGGRGIVSEFFTCFPIVGRLTAPYLHKQCGGDWNGY